MSRSGVFLMDVVSLGRTVRCIAINLCELDERSRNKKRQTCRFREARNGRERTRRTIRVTRKQIRSPENEFQDRRTQSSKGPSASALEVSSSHDERLVGECARKNHATGMRISSWCMLERELALPQRCRAYTRSISFLPSRREEPFQSPGLITLSLSMASRMPSHCRVGKQ